MSEYSENKEEEELTIIIDIGQASTKVGYAGEEKPRAIFPTVVGKPKYQQMAGVQTQEIYVGDDTTHMRGVLKLEYPINRGSVMNWEEYYAILNHIFYNILRVEPENCNVIYLIPPLTPPDIAQYFARVLFETHECKRVALIDSATTAVFSVGFTTGLSINIGAGITTVTPVMNGQIYNPSIRRVNLAGMDVEEYLGKLLTQYGIFQKKEIITEIKEKALKIPLNPEQAVKDESNDYNFVLPDGERLKINAYIACMAAEILFNPQLVSQSAQSLPQAIISSLQTVDPYYLQSLLGKIILSGGTSFIPGLKDRLKQELIQLIPILGEIPIETTDKTPPKSSQPSTDSDSKGEEETITDKDLLENCPKCGELINPKSNVFCPNCGAKLHWDQISILDEEGKRLSRKERKLMKKTAVDEDDLAKIADMVANEYGSDEDYEEIIEMEEEIEKQPPQPEELIHIFEGKDRHFASFKGAAILGALPSFKRLMLNHETFKEKPDQIIVDFKEVMDI